MVVGLVAVGAALSDRHMPLGAFEPSESAEARIVGTESHFVFTLGGCKAIILEGALGVEIQRKYTVFPTENQDFLFFVGG